MGQVFATQFFETAVEHWERLVCRLFTIRKLQRIRHSVGQAELQAPAAGPSVSDDRVHETDGRVIGESKTRQN